MGEGIRHKAPTGLNLEEEACDILWRCGSPPKIKRGRGEGLYGEEPTVNGRLNRSAVQVGAVTSLWILNCFSFLHVNPRL